MGLDGIHSNGNLDDKIIVIKDRNGNEQRVQLSVFVEGMAITSDNGKAISLFDINKDNKIDKSEAEKIKQAISEAANNDNVLDDNEILSIFKLDANAVNAKTILQQFKIMVERQFRGTLSTQTNINVGTIINNFNRDGSGTSVTKLKNGVTITKTYSKGNVLETVVNNYPNGSSVIEEYTNNEYGNPISCTKKKNNKIVETVSYKYDESNRLIEQKNTSLGNKKQQIFGHNFNTSKVTTITHEYYDDTNIKKRTTIKKPNLTEEVSEFNKEGKIVKNTRKTMKLFTNKNNNGKVNGVSLHQSTITMDYTYTNSGKTISSHGTDMNGNESESTFYYDKNNKPISGEKTYYKRGAKIQERYEGNNLSNRISGRVPSERIEYEEGDNTKIKKRTVFHFDKDGIVIGDEIFDANGNKIGEHDYTTLDGKFNTAYQVNRGDCYLLAAVNSLAATEEGTKMLNDCIKKDGNNYVVSFPGAAIAKRELISKLKAKNPNFDESKINIPDKYTITDSELHQAMKQSGAKYTFGDKDVLLLEVAYEKFRTVVAKNLAANKIHPHLFISNLNFNPEYTSKGDYLSGGKASEVIFALTGKKSEEEYFASAQALQTTPTCYIDSNYKMHIANPNGQVSTNNMLAKTLPSEVRSSDIRVRDEIINKLIKDCEDGKLDEYAATTGFNVSSQEVNGHVITGGGHAFSIKKITKDEVTLSNPWNPEVDVMMSMEDFKRSLIVIQIVALNKTSNTSASGRTGRPNTQTPDTQQLQNLVNRFRRNHTRRTNTQPSSRHISGKERESYTALIIGILKELGIPATVTNITKAKEQFEEANPNAIQIVGKNSRGEIKKLLIDEVIIPKFNIDDNENII